MLQVKLIDAEGGGVGEGAKSFDGEKAWSSIIHSYSLGSLYLGLIVTVRKWPELIRMRKKTI